MSDLSDRELLDALGVDAEPEPQAARTPREERIIAGFEDIQRFFEENGRIPQPGNDRGIFERLYAVRLERLRTLDECRTLLEPMDHQGLLSLSDTVPPSSEGTADEVDDAELLARLGVTSEGDEITNLRHVRSSAERRAAERVAQRRPCADFDSFEPLFRRVQEELDNGERQTTIFEMKADIRPGCFFIVGGQKAYVAEMGELSLTEQGRTDARLRVIFDNGTESDMLMRSLQRALNADENGRRISEPWAGPLFGDAPDAGDEASGVIYVLRSESDEPYIAANRNIIHKIGVTNMDVSRRIAGARLQPTFLLADVRVVATYELFHIDRNKLEKLLHRVFASARLEITIRDRFGNPVIPREWFQVPLKAIDEAVNRLKDGSLTKYAYDPETARLRLRNDAEER